eukprot:TRINITY_DN572_c8_g1_i1.p2 TRINITY_DN572_c8_g1~~TRINITY_DN572_c8_g1_i1.p2  ORF type:complete len:144 (+),score=29.06 TRINITY_DN572_c8_g1_i1:147-578(+)
MSFSLLQSTCCKPSVGAFARTPFTVPQKRSRGFIRVKAETSTEQSFDVEKLIDEVKVKWDSVDNKQNVAIYGVGAIAAVWLASTLVGAVNAVPLLPKMMELVGLGYSAWFVYRYLLFKSSREELIEDVEGLKKKIAGTEENGQ